MRAKIKGAEGEEATPARGSPRAANRRRQGARAGANGGGERDLGFGAGRKGDGEGERADSAWIRMRGTSFVGGDARLVARGTRLADAWTRVTRASPAEAEERRIVRAFIRTVRQGS